jgi:hypothetical protein
MRLNINLAPQPYSSIPFCRKWSYQKLHILLKIYHNIKIFSFTLKGHNVHPIFRSQGQYIGMLDVRELSGTDVGWPQLIRKCVDKQRSALTDWRIIFNCNLIVHCFLPIIVHFQTKKNSVASVRKRIIPTERPPLVGEVSANFSG